MYAYTTITKEKKKYERAVTALKSKSSEIGELECAVNPSFVTFPTPLLPYPLSRGVRWTDFAKRRRRGRETSTPAPPH